MGKRLKKFFLHIRFRFGLRVYIVDDKNEIFTIFSALAMCKNVMISDISCKTLIPHPEIDILTAKIRPGAHNWPRKPE